MTSILDVMGDPRLLGPWFKGDSWRPWRVAQAALFGLPIAPDDMELFTTLTGLTEAPTTRAQEAHLICGRRSGKSINTAAIAVFLACFCEWRQHLAPGELGIIMILCPDRKQSQIVLRYVMAMLTDCPMLKPLVKRSDRESIELTNGLEIRISTVSIRTIRGYTICAAILDELAFWRSEESVNPDEEVVNAILPSLATTPGSMLIGLSSPHRKAGILYNRHKNYWAVPGAIRIIKGPTPLMNSTVPPEVIAEAVERDAAVARAEWFAEFRDDVGAAFDPDLIDQATRENHDYPPQAETNYEVFVDTSGGRHDSYTIAIAHRDADNRYIVDACRDRHPPFDPAQVTKEYADLAKQYGRHTVTGDHYSGEWVVAEFAKHRISYQPANRPKSKIYLEAIPLFSTGLVEIPGNKRLVAELKQLERRVRPGGRDTIDHPVGGRDDLANSVCGALVGVASAGVVDIDPSMYQLVMGSVALPVRPFETGDEDHDIL